MKSLNEITRNDMNTPRYARARRFSDTVLSIMRDFVPNDRHVHRRILEYLLEVGWENNAEVINVPPELDALDKLQLEKHMLEAHPMMVNATSVLPTTPPPDRAPVTEAEAKAAGEIIRMYPMNEANTHPINGWTEMGRHVIEAALAAREAQSERTALVSELLDLLALARRIDAADEFGPLHIVVADGNMGDDHISFCLGTDEPRKPTEEEIQLCNDLLELDEEIRYFAFWLTYSWRDLDDFEARLKAPRP